MHDLANRHLDTHLLVVEASNGKIIQSLFAVRWYTILLRYFDQIAVGAVGALLLSWWAGIWSAS